MRPDCGRAKPAIASRIAVFPAPGGPCSAVIPSGSVQIDIELLANDACVGHKAATMDHSASTRTKATAGRRQNRPPAKRQHHAPENPPLRTAQAARRIAVFPIQILQRPARAEHNRRQRRNHPGRGAGLPREYGPQKEPRQNHTQASQTTGPAAPVRPYGRQTPASPTGIRARVPAPARPPSRCRRLGD